MKTLAWVVAAICSLQDVGAMYKKAGRAEHLADDQSLNVSQSMGSVTSTTTMNLDAGDPNILPTAHNLEHSLLHKLEEKAVEIKREHPTKKHMDEQKKEADAKHEHTIHLCQRDYSQPCPLGFKHIAAEDGGHRCIPPSSYTGPCMGQDLVYRAMPAEEKASWATSCLANWPCVRCRRRYSDLCPEKWELDKRDNTSKGMCKASDDYEGPCKDDKISFLNYNIEMQKQWSHRCQAWWPCDNGSKPGPGPDADLPITLAATVYRMTH